MQAHAGWLLAVAALQAELRSGQGLDLAELVAERRVEVEIQGQRIDSVQVTVRSLVDEELWVQIPAGTYFASFDPAVQDMVCVRGLELLLEARGSETIPVDAACANRTKAIPDREQRFGLHAAPEREELARLAQTLGSQQLDYRERQAAVWIATDDATDQEIAELLIRRVGETQGGERAISQAQVVRGMRHCADAGIDLATKAIWRDRWLLYAATLENQESDLAGWLEGRGVSFDTSAASLADPDPGVRASTCLALARLGDARAVPALIDVLRDQDAAVRAEAAAALGGLGDARAVEPLCALLRDESVVVLQTTTNALGILGDPRAVLPLLGLFEPGRSRYAGLAHYPLVQIGDPTAVALLLERFDAMDSHGRSSALDVFADLADARALECILAAAADASSGLREQAIRALKVFREPADLERTLPALVRVASAPEPSPWPGEPPRVTLQRAAVQTLGILGDLRALEVLLEASTSATIEVRQDAAWALSKLADPRARASVFRLLAEDESFRVRETAAHGLAILPDPGSIDPLLGAFSDADVSVSAAAAKSLVAVAGEQAIDPLIDLLEDPERSEFSRLRAANTLCELTHQPIYGLDPAPWRAWQATRE